MNKLPSNERFPYLGTPFSQVENCFPLLFCIFIWLAGNLQAEDPVFRYESTPKDIARWKRSTEWVRSLEESELVKLIPEQAGLRYIDCPHCDGGRQENQLEWSPESPEAITCRFCKHRYPSSDYPDDRRLIVPTPTGKQATYPYWENEKGYRHFFQARLDDEKRSYFAEKGKDLALLYWATKEESYARRSAIILDRFAQVFPNWCYHYDYPHQQKVIFEGMVTPSQFRPGYRTARWTWWAYSDIPVPLVQAYDLLRTSRAFDELTHEQGLDVRKRIENDLIRNACEQVIANRDELTNMSPTAWAGLIQAGRIIQEPRYVHESIRRLERLVETKFFYDGAWSEGSPDYGRQSLNGLEKVIELVRGYSDPDGYRTPDQGNRLDDVDLQKSFPSLSVARETLSKWRLPNGRPVPVHDTWSTSQIGPLTVSRSYLLPALGHACLGSGEGKDQIQFHLTWSGGYGHSHADHLSLLLYANDREHLSDLGYSHTAYRAWTLATAAHNTVVIDGKNQSLGRTQTPTDGQLIHYSISDPRVQVVRASGIRGYAEVATKYERNLIVVDAGEGHRYAVDCFDVEGGTTHDYFLHGDADRESQIRCNLPTEELSHIGPERSRWIAPRHEGETSKISEPYYAYGFLNDLQRGILSPNSSQELLFEGNSGGPGVRVTLLPNQQGELILGKNSSIRRAGEDDAKLKEFQRPFLMWRQSAGQPASPFVAVIEPYDARPYVKSIERIATSTETIVVKIELPDRTDYVVLHAKLPWKGSGPTGDFTFQGDIGVVSFRSNSIDHRFSIGEGGWTIGKERFPSEGVREATLDTIEENAFCVLEKGISLPRQGEVVRLVTPDGWVYPFHVQDSRIENEIAKIFVVEPLAITFDRSQKRLNLRSFPQREHQGTFRLQWIEAVHSF